MEHWKNIIETDGKYQVSDLGRVKSIKTNRIIKSNYSNTGYLRFSACFNGHHKTLYIHKIEFEAFVANHILSKNIYVFHKNKVNDDNWLDNLYVDSSESDIPKNENFKVISETDGKYSVGNLGDIIFNSSIGSDGKKYARKLVPQNLNTSGYCQVVLCYHKTQKHLLVHRLVAEAFIPNPENRPTVNHKDEITTNNKVTNLEWMTQKEQNTYGKFNGVKSKAKTSSPRTIIGKVNSKIIFKFGSISEAHRRLGISIPSISACCNHKVKHAGKYHNNWISWEFLD